MTPDVAWTEVDGVTTLRAPGRGTRIKAGLFFRVGCADETLATAGITHLVEHLALHQQGVGDYHYNGATADLYTHFHVEGSADHVVEYFDSVCTSLHDLPVHRLETEKELLRTERAGRGGGPAAQIPLLRYGAQGYGLSACQEMGLPGIQRSVSTGGPRATSLGTTRSSGSSETQCRRAFVSPFQQASPTRSRR